jgi:hypothetical protein
MSKEDRYDRLLGTDWGDLWDTLVEAPPLVGIPVSRSSRVPDGEVLYFGVLPGADGRGHVYVSTHDAYGDLYRLPGEKWPLYTRHTLGGREAARERRRRRWSST